MTKREIDKKIDIFFNQIVWLNINVFILEKIIKFPWKTLRIFHSYENFINSFFKNYFENSILIARKVYFDNNKDFLSLKELKQHAFENIKGDQEKYDLLKNSIKPIEKNLNIYKEKIEKVRHNKLAHLKRILLDTDDNTYGISFKELKIAVENINQYYRIVMNYGWNVGESLLIPMDYHPIHSNQLADIDRLLRKIAEDSEVIRCYEENPHLWQAYERKWTTNEERIKNLEIINFYRKELFDLPPII